MLLGCCIMCVSTCWCTTLTHFVKLGLLHAVIECHWYWGTWTWVWELNWTELKIFSTIVLLYMYIYYINSFFNACILTYYNIPTLFATLLIYINWIAAPIKYPYGSRGPPQSDMLLKRVRSSYNQNGLPRVVLTHWVTNPLFNRISFLGGICLQPQVFLGPSSECFPAYYWWLSVLTCTCQLLFG